MPRINYGMERENERGIHTLFDPSMAMSSSLSK